MSYARFASEGSDVYVYLDVGGYLCCCACGLGASSQKIQTTEEMIAHLRKHQEAGDTVPESCFEGLRHDASENDAWIAEANK